MNKSLFGKGLANACSVPVDDVPKGVSGIFLTHFIEFMEEMEWIKKAEPEDLVKGLDFFTLINVNGESGSSNDSNAIFAMITF